MIKKTLPGRSENPEASKNNPSSSKALQLLCPYSARTCWGCSTGCFAYNFVIQVISVLLEIREILLHESNRNYNSFRFSYKFNFILFSVLSYKPKTRIWFSASWWSSNEKYFCFLFIGSRALLQSHAEFNRHL